MGKVDEINAKRNTGTIASTTLTSAGIPDRGAHPTKKIVTKTLTKALALCRCHCSARYSESNHHKLHSLKETTNRDTLKNNGLARRLQRKNRLIGNSVTSQPKTKKNNSGVGHDRPKNESDIQSMKTNRGAESDQIAVGVGGARKKQTQTESDSSPCIRGTGQVGALHQSFFGIPMRSTQLVVQSIERIHKGDCGRSKESTMKLNEASISTFCLSSTMWKEKLLQQPFETANS